MVKTEVIKKARLRVSSRIAESTCKENKYSWCRDHFTIKFVSETIGRGIFAERAFKQGDFLLMYDGTLLTEEPAEGQDDTYVFESGHRGQTYWTDATAVGTLGRLINDSHLSPNILAKVIILDGIPGVGFFARKGIEPGDELRYCYGKRGDCYPWRQKHGEKSLKRKSQNSLTYCGPYKKSFSLGKDDAVTLAQESNEQEKDKPVPPVPHQQQHHHLNVVVINSGSSSSSSPTSSIRNDDSVPVKNLLQHSISLWEGLNKMDCTERPAMEQKGKKVRFLDLESEKEEEGMICTGARTSRRQFTHGAPPVIVLSASYLSTARGLLFTDVPNKVKVLSTNLPGKSTRCRAPPVPVESDDRPLNLLPINYSQRSDENVAPSPTESDSLAPVKLAENLDNNTEINNNLIKKTSLTDQKTDPTTNLPSNLPTDTYLTITSSKSSASSQLKEDNTCRSSPDHTKEGNSTPTKEETGPYTGDKSALYLDKSPEVPLPSPARHRFEAESEAEVMVGQTEYPPSPPELMIQGSEVTHNGYQPDDTDQNSLPGKFTRCPAPPVPVESDDRPLNLLPINYSQRSDENVAPSPTESDSLAPVKLAENLDNNTEINNNLIKKTSLTDQKTDPTTNLPSNLPTDTYLTITSSKSSASSQLKEDNTCRSSPDHTKEGNSTPTKEETGPYTGDKSALYLDRSPEVPLPSPARHRFEAESEAEVMVGQTEYPPSPPELMIQGSEVTHNGYQPDDIDQNSLPGKSTRCPAPPVPVESDDRPLNLLPINYSRRSDENVAPSPTESDSLAPVKLAENLDNNTEINNNLIKKTSLADQKTDPTTNLPSNLPTDTYLTITSSKSSASSQLKEDNTCRSSPDHTKEGNSTPTKEETGPYTGDKSALYLDRSPEVPLPSPARHRFEAESEAEVMVGQTEYPPSPPELTIYHKGSEVTHNGYQPDDTDQNSLPGKSPHYSAPPLPVESDDRPPDLPPRNYSRRSDENVAPRPTESASLAPVELAENLDNNTETSAINNNLITVNRKRKDVEKLRNTFENSAHEDVYRDQIRKRAHRLFEQQQISHPMSMQLAHSKQEVSIWHSYRHLPPGFQEALSTLTMSPASSLAITPIRVPVVSVSDRQKQTSLTDQNTDPTTNLPSNLPTDTYLTITSSKSSASSQLKEDNTCRSSPDHTKEGNSTPTKEETGPYTGDKSALYLDRSPELPLPSPARHRFEEESEAEVMVGQTEYPPSPPELMIYHKGSEVTHNGYQPDDTDQNSSQTHGSNTDSNTDTVDVDEVKVKPEPKRKMESKQHQLVDYSSSEESDNGDHDYEPKKDDTDDTDYVDDSYDSDTSVEYAALSQEAGAHPVRALNISDPPVKASTINNVEPTYIVHETLCSTMDKSHVTVGAKPPIATLNNYLNTKTDKLCGMLKDTPVSVFDKLLVTGLNKQPITTVDLTVNRDSCEFSEPVSSTSSIEPLDFDNYFSNSDLTKDIPAVLNQIDESSFPSSSSQLSLLPVSSDIEHKDVYITPIRESEFSSRLKTQKKKKKLRVFNKCSNCLYCQKVTTNSSKHYISKHSDEPKVAKILSLKSGSHSKDAKAEWTILRNEGNHEHNKKVIFSKSGELLLVRRPHNDFSMDDYTPCPRCKGWYLKQSIWTHVNNRCILKDSGRMTSSSILKKSHFNKFESRMSKLDSIVFLSMRKNEFTKVARKDKIIREVGSYHLQKHSGNPLKCKSMASKHMRQAARLLIKIRDIDESNGNLSSYIKPHKFEVVQKAAVLIAGGESDSYSDLTYPSTLKNLGYELKHYAEIKEEMAISSMNKDDITDSKFFLKLYKRRWKLLSSSAQKQLEERHYNSPIELPSKEILDKVTAYIKNSIDEVDKQETNSIQYKMIAELIQTRLVLFNKRRPGELEALRLKDFLKYSNNNTVLTDAVKKTMSALEKMMLGSHNVVTVRGKRSRPVPILLPTDCMKSLKRLADQTVRANAGVKSSNPYLFANTGDAVYKAAQSLKNVLENCGCDNVALNLVKSSNLRKYFSTNCQLLNLSDTELDWVTRHLGHSKLTHMENYRLTSSTIERTKIAKLLVILEKGLIEEAQGKNLNDKDLDDLVLRRLIHEDIVNGDAHDEEMKDAVDETSDGEESAAAEGDENAAEVDGEDTLYESNIEADEVSQETEETPAEPEMEEEVEQAQEATVAKVHRHNMKWSTEAIGALKREFHIELRERRDPSFAQIREVQRKYSVLLGMRTEAQVKSKLTHIMKN